MATRRPSVSSNRTRAFDRFIPYRPSLDIDASYARLKSISSDSMENEPAQYKSSNAKAYWKLLGDAVQNKNGKILPLSSSSPKITSPFSPNRNKFFPTSPDEGYGSPTADRQRRRIPSSPECIMDMPGLRDDFYTNLLDWSKRNLIAVALYQSAYVWNADSKECQRIEIHFPDPETSHFYISALCWSSSDKLLAISDNEGEIVICDVEQMKSHRKFSHSNKKRSIGSLLWSDEFGIISGNRKGTITLHDTRCKEHKSTVHLSGHHSKEVCGLRMLPLSTYLASGGDDGIVNIWDLRMSKCYRTIHAHTACTKALSWCPWKRSVIASGGGSSDGHIRLWHIHTGEKIAEAFTKSQICGLVWSNEYTELISAHGSATPDKNDLTLWNMKQFEFEPTAILRQHMARPLHLALSPDETTVASAGADEALCLWKTFPKRVSKQKSSWDSSPLNLFRAIR